MTGLIDRDDMHSFFRKKCPRKHQIQARFCDKITLTVNIQEKYQKWVDTAALNL
jgi:hypothetical protein